MVKKRAEIKKMIDRYIAELGKFGVDVSRVFYMNVKHNKNTVAGDIYNE